MPASALTPPAEPALPRRSLRLRLLVTLAGGMAVASGLAPIISSQQAWIIFPTLATLEIFLIFSMTLSARVGGRLFGELGFLYSLFIVTYTVLPAFTFLALNLDVAPGWVWQKLTLLLPDFMELGLHLWRHALFFGCFCIGYLVLRGRAPLQLVPRKVIDPVERPTILVLFTLLLVCTSCMLLLSAPVKSYIDNYTRYDQLAWAPRKFVALCARLKNGSFIILITLLFRNIKRYRFSAFILATVMFLFEIVYSFGSRIESLIVLLNALCLFHLYVRPVTLKMGLAACMIIGTFFSAVEILRANEFDLGATTLSVETEGANPASEFGAVFFTGFHLYSERNHGSLPPKEWPMFFYDFTSLVTPNGFTRWNPQVLVRPELLPRLGRPAPNQRTYCRQRHLGGRVRPCPPRLDQRSFFCLHRQVAHHPKGQVVGGVCLCVLLRDQRHDSEIQRILALESVVQNVPAYGVPGDRNPNGSC